MGDGPNNGALVEWRKMHATVMRMVATLAALLGLLVYFLIDVQTRTRTELRITRDTVLQSLQQARDSGTVQRARLGQRIDSLVKTRKR